MNTLPLYLMEEDENYLDDFSLMYEESLIAIEQLNASRMINQAIMEATCIKERNVNGLIQIQEGFFETIKNGITKIWNSIVKMINKFISRIGQLFGFHKGFLNKYRDAILRKRPIEGVTLEMYDYKLDKFHNITFEVTAARDIIEKATDEDTVMKMISPKVFGTNTKRDNETLKEYIHRYVCGEKMISVSSERLNMTTMYNFCISIDDLKKSIKENAAKLQDIEAEVEEALEKYYKEAKEDPDGSAAVAGEYDREQEEKARKEAEEKAKKEAEEKAELEKTKREAEVEQREDSKEAEAAEKAGEEKAQATEPENQPDTSTTTSTNTTEPENQPDTSTTTSTTTTNVNPTPNTTNAQNAKQNNKNQNKNKTGMSSREAKRLEREAEEKAKKLKKEAEKKAKEEEDAKKKAEAAAASNTGINASAESYTTGFVLNESLEMLQELVNFSSNKAEVAKGAVDNASGNGKTTLSNKANKDLKYNNYNAATAKRTGQITAGKNEDLEELQKNVQMYYKVGGEILSAKLTTCVAIFKDYMKIIRWHVTNFTPKERKTPDATEAKGKEYNDVSKENEVEREKLIPDENEEAEAATT